MTMAARPHEIVIAAGRSRSSRRIVEPSEVVNLNVSAIENTLRAGDSVELCHRGDGNRTGMPIEHRVVGEVLTTYGELLAEAQVSHVVIDRFLCDEPAVLIVEIGA